MHSWFENESVSCTVCLTLWSHGLYVAHQAPLYMKFSWFSVLRFKPVGSCDIDIDCVSVLKSHAFFPCTFCGDMLTSKYMPFKILIFQHRAFSVVGWHRIHLLCGNTGLIPGLGRSPGEGNGNPLQSSCLKNPMDRGAWWATVHVAAKSQTWFSNLTTAF